MTSWAFPAIGAAAAFLAAIAAGIVGAWIPKPSVTVRNAIIALIGIGVIGTVATVVQVANSGFSEALADQDAAPPHSAASNAASELPEGLLSRTILLWDDSPGPSFLSAMRLDGANRQPSGYSGGENIEPLPRSTDFIASGGQDGDAPGSFSLRVYAFDGGSLRRLTSPGPNFEDSSPSIARDEGVVYFTREHSNTSTNIVELIGIYSAPLDGSQPESPVDLPVALRYAASSDDGAVLAGECTNNGGPMQICVILNGVDVLRVPGHESSGMGDAAVSPDGSMVAFDSVKGNADGIQQIYIYDLDSASVRQVSALPGWNSHPNWAHGTSTDCLAFDHYETGGNAIYVACAPDWKTIKVADYGYLPVWLDVRD